MDPVERQPLLLNEWAPEDTGIDPNGPIFQGRRVDQTVGEVSGFESCLINTLFLATFPLSCCSAFLKVPPMTDTIVSTCGRVTQVLREPGVHYINPCCTTTEEVYMGLEDIEIRNMAANDLDGKPLVVSAQFVYRVSDSITAAFRTKTLKKFLTDQADSALRGILAQYHFDVVGDGECLRRYSQHIHDRLKQLLQSMVGMAGIKIESFRLFSIGIESRMEKLLLARQEAEAENIARTAIAEGATGIIEATLSRLSALGITLTDHERNRFATTLTLLLVNRGGHSTLNIFDQGQPPPQPIMALPQQLQSQ